MSDIREPGILEDEWPCDHLAFYDDDLVVEVVMSDDEADGVGDLYTPMDYATFKATFEDDMAWFDDMVSKMAKGDYHDCVHMGRKIPNI